MAKYSFIDFGNRDFVRYENGEKIEIEVSSVEEAEDWLLKNGDTLTDWTNSGISFLNWDEGVE